MPSTVISLQKCSSANHHLMLVVKHLSRPGLEVEPFTIAAGECVVLTGASGSGKSLLLRAIADLDLNSGELQVGELLRSRTPAPQWRRTVAYVPAESGWWADQVGEHFHDQHTTRSQLQALRLPTDCLQWPVSRLSTGEKQRLALLRTLVQKPQVLLLDEPTAALDTGAVAAVEAVLHNELARGVALLLVTHNQAQAARLAQRRLLIVNGRVSEVKL